jgi:hypothetical protein
VTGWGWYFSVYPVMASTGGTQVFKNKKIFQNIIFLERKSLSKIFDSDAVVSLTLLPMEGEEAVRAPVFKRPRSLKML